MPEPESPEQDTGSLHSFAAARLLFRSIADEPAAADAEPPPAGSTPGSDPSHDLPRIPGYQLHERLGRGAGGDVFAATRDGMPQRFAVKILNRQLGVRSATQRAWRELQLLSQLRLECLPRLLDYGETDGRLFLVTELIEGSTLLEHCQADALNRRARAELLAMVADAVHTLHEQGVLHRDLKPSNIIIDSTGRPLIVDFGIASLLADDVMETLTADGVPIGSPAFMSPEQARGDRREINTRSDVYGLGATAYMVLTGEPPHDADATLHETLHRITHDQPRDPRALDSKMPKPLADVLRKAVSPKPADRYASTAEFAADLRRWLAGDAVEAGSMGPMQRVCRTVARHPFLATAGLCVLMAGVFIAAVVLTTWRMAYVPSDVVVDRNGIARLISRSGNVLHTWRAQNLSNIHGGWLIDADDHGIEHDLVVLGFTRANQSPFDRKLIAFRADDPETIQWSIDDSPSEFDPPPRISLWETNPYRVEWLSRADVFDDPPGDELIAVHRNADYSPVSIRIYDMRGNVLYEAWHDGELSGLHWIEDQRRLICIGVNSECGLSERGEGLPYTNIASQSHPLVVFALDINEKTRHRKWVSPRTLPVTMPAAWYKCVLPIEEYDRIFNGRKMLIAFNEGATAPSHDGLEIALYARRDDQPINLVLIINSAGEVIHHRRTSQFRTFNPDYDITPLYLGEMPKYNRTPPIPAPQSAQSTP